MRNGRRMSLICYSRSDQAGIESFERNSRSGEPSAAPQLRGKPLGALTRMRDIVIGIAFLAMLLSPALVASFSKRKSDDEA